MIGEICFLFLFFLNDYSSSGLAGDFRISQSQNIDSTNTKLNSTQATKKKKKALYTILSHPKKKFYLFKT